MSDQRRRNRRSRTSRRTKDPRQCHACFAAGLSLGQSKAYCAICKARCAAPKTGREAIRVSTRAVYGIGNRDPTDRRQPVAAQPPSFS